MILRSVWLVGLSQQTLITTPKIIDFTLSEMIQKRQLTLLKIRRTIYFARLLRNNLKTLVTVL